jgi:hypothetical protein
MKLFKLFFALIFLSILSCDGSGESQSSNSINQSYTVLIPLYSYPNGQYASQWDKLLSFNPKENTNVVVVINPDNGPGNQVDNVFVEKINQLKSKKFKVLGYVRSSYSNRSIDEIKNDIDKWTNFYTNIDGFFIDEVLDGKNQYYSQIVDYVKSKSQNFLTVANSGTEVNPDYFNIFNKVIIAEMPYQTFINYNIHYDYSKIDNQNKCVIVYDIKSVDEFYKAKNKALNLNSLCMYFTNYSSDEIYFKISDYLDKI